MMASESAANVRSAERESDVLESSDYAFDSLATKNGWDYQSLEKVLRKSVEEISTGKTFSNDQVFQKIDSLLL